ncbi:hypothetical protein KM043_018412 [Ampulex compressa]|nr:hypothetical protein KM043_018412 [Ampulex compressa]
MYHASRLQFVITEMEKYCKREEDYVQNILQKAVDSLLKYYGPFCFWALFNAVIFISGPIFLQQDFPTHAEYPFSVEGTLRKCVIFVNQAVVTIQCIGHVNMNVFVAVLLWFTVARFQVLAFEFSRTTDINGIVNCVKEHINLISYTNEVVRAVRFLILSELGSCSIRLIFSGLTLIRPQPVVVISQYIILNATALVSVFICIWPADSLMDANNMIRRAAYDAMWYEIPNIRETLNIILVRCERQLAVSASFILPAASLPYYRQFVSTAVSYFTVLRMVLEEDDGGP